MVVVVEQKKPGLEMHTHLEPPSLLNPDHVGGGGVHGCWPMVMAVVNVCHQRLTITCTAMYFVLVIELISIKKSVSIKIHEERKKKDSLRPK